MKKIFWIFGFLLVGLFALAAFKYTQPNSRDFANAKANYTKYCASCHGEKLETFVNRKWIYGNSWNEVFKAIKLGYPNDGMPAYQEAFSDREINALVDYILNGIEQLAFDDFEKEAKLTGKIQSDQLEFRLETVVSGLDIPWGLAFLPSGDILITERSGKFYRFGNDQKLQRIKGVPEVLARGQGGLMDVEVHPDFSKNNYIYLSYSKRKNDLATTAILRAKLEGNELKEQKDIFIAQPYLRTRHHYGSRMEFDKNGYLFLTVGDRGKRNRNPQNLNNHCGKIHRIHDDGRIPSDNPFVNQAGAIKSIYSFGHRNPQGLAIDPETDLIWTNEHGPRGGDEVNIIRKGKNYGWPIISYGINYSGSKFTNLTEKEGMEQPLHYWVPSIGVCGLAVVTSNQYPNWKGDILSGSLRFDYLSRLKIENGKVIGEEKLLKNVGRLRDVKMGLDGLIYFTTEDPGTVFRIVPVN